VTVSPGLVGALLVGRMTAEALGLTWEKPVVGVNHIEGHLYSPSLHEPKLKPPFLGLVVSGGHTDLLYAQAWGKVTQVGSTRDDAAGEAFDKVARMLDLPYPGGPAIDRLAKLGNAARAPFPKPWLPGTWDFSFSGLKTAVLYLLEREKKISSQRKKDLCAGFQASVTDILVGKTIAAARALKVKTVVMGGGVAANSELRRKMSDAAQLNGLKLCVAQPAYCTDNAAMIAAAAYHKFTAKTANSLKVQSQAPFPKYLGQLPAFHIPTAN
jgi:N6-L-threonylcarbamoyladenine synthase